MVPVERFLVLALVLVLGALRVSEEEDENEDEDDLQNRTSRPQILCDRLGPRLDM